MAIKDRVWAVPESGLIISRKGPIDFDLIYKNVVPWFGRYKYDFTEKEHTEKNKPQGNELIIKWVADRKIDDYMQYFIELEFFITELRIIGKQQHAKTKINLKSYVKLDYNNEFQKSRFGRFLFFLYNNVIIKRKLLFVHKVKLYKETMDLHDLIKSLLEHYR